MFQFRRFPTYCYLIHSRLLEVYSSGLPHSEISGSMLICSSPKLIAACHVLHRLLMPRHSPCALSSLTFLIPFGISGSLKFEFELCRLISYVYFLEIVSYPKKYLFPYCCLLIICIIFMVFSFQGAVESLGLIETLC